MKNNLLSDFSHISPTIRFLTVSDVMLGTALGLFAPIFAVYLTDKLNSADALEIIGIGTSIYLFTRSLGQVPIAYVLDKVKGERDDFIALTVGSLIFVIVPILYIFISEPWHLFVIQFFYGIGSAIALPAWMAIFTHHIDKGKEGTEWSIYQTAVDLSGAVAAPIGAFIATIYGFTAVMLMASALSAISSVFILFIKKDLRKR